MRRGAGLCMPLQSFAQGNTGTGSRQGPLAHSIALPLSHSGFGGRRPLYAPSIRWMSPLPQSFCLPMNHSPTVPGGPFGA
ncbi:hypothetical protein VTK26DRAFT_6117 [Humicola hyalothermophila]